MGAFSILKQLPFNAQIHLLVRANFISEVTLNARLATTTQSRETRFPLASGSPIKDVSYLSPYHHRRLLLRLLESSFSHVARKNRCAYRAVKL